MVLTDAQARARRYPKAAPGFERDAGWEGDPTEGNEDLVRVIRARRASCLTTFAAKKVLVLRSVGGVWNGWSAFDTTADKLDHYRDTSLLVWVRKE